MSKLKIGINGFGRIGRQVFRILYEKYKNEAEIVAINDLYDAKTNFHLLAYDSSYGQFTPEINIDGAKVQVGDWQVHCFAERDPAKLTWGDFGVDIVIEATGIFKSAKQAQVHIDNGAKKVIITAPAKEEDITIVMGVNEHKYDPKKHHIISNASCTTNCLAPLALILQENFGIRVATMVTVHSYTNDQRILDLPHSDLRRARAAACNIVPTSTGAAKAVALVIPELKGKFSGYCLRVPTPTVSIVDFTAFLEKNTTTEELLSKIKSAADTKLKGILEYCDKPLVSMDFKGNSHSSILDAEYTNIQDGNVAKVVSWYDNEWGYSNRVADLSIYFKNCGL